MKKKKSNKQFPRFKDTGLKILHNQTLLTTSKDLLGILELKRERN